MWSNKFTGTTGVVRDSYQRVLVKLSIHDFMTDSCFTKLNDYVGAYQLRHVYLVFDLDKKNIDISKIKARMDALLSLTLNEEKLIFSCELVNFQNSDLLRDIIQILSPSTLLVQRIATRDMTLSAIDTLASVLSLLEKTDVVIGVSGLLECEMQYCIDARRQVLRLIHLGEYSANNMRANMIELAHSRGCNTLLTVSDIRPHKLKSSALTKIAELYNKPQAIVLAKALLQLGTLVVFPCDIDSRFMSNEILKLAHPFVHELVCTLSSKR